jgi:hypothetical protein
VQIVGERREFKFQIISYTKLYANAMTEFGKVERPPSPRHIFNDFSLETLSGNSIVERTFPFFSYLFHIFDDACSLRGRDLLIVFALKPSIDLSESISSWKCMSKKMFLFKIFKGIILKFYLRDF